MKGGSYGILSGKKNGVIAVSIEGRIEEGPLLIGCDGIKYVARSLRFAQHGLSPEDASFTGLTQVLFCSQSSLVRSFEIVVRFN